MTSERPFPRAVVEALAERFVGLGVAQGAAALVLGQDVLVVLDEHDYRSPRNPRSPRCHLRKRGTPETRSGFPVRQPGSRPQPLKPHQPQRVSLSVRPEEDP